MNARDREHTIYGFHDTDGRLIYVGCTIDLEARETAHSHGAWWWPQVNRVSILATAPNKREGIWKERQMIETHRPRWNQMHRLYHRQRWSLDDYLDVILSRLVAGGFSLDPDMLKRCRALPLMIAEVNAEFGLSLSIDAPHEVLKTARRGIPIPQKYIDLLTDHARLISTEQVAA